MEWLGRIEGWTRRFSAAITRPGKRSWRAPREPRTTTSQIAAVGRSKLDGSLHELERSNGNGGAFRAQIFALACMVELRPKATAGHLQRVSSYCEILCRQIRFSIENCELVRLASQLHDVGNVVVPDELLLKRGKLTPREYEIVKGHAAAGHTVLGGCRSAVAQVGGLIAHSHHERWDGGGYPQGLCDREIPLLGRIVAVADCFDALTSDRLYRSALPTTTAIEVMRDERGASLDPHLIDEFLKALPDLEVVQHAHLTP